MRPTKLFSARTWAVLAAIVLSTTVRAEDDAGDGSPRAAAAPEATPPGAILDEPPSDEESSQGEAPAPRHRRRWTDGTRRVPRPGGASYERAQRLGLGSHELGSHLLHHPIRADIARAAGPSRPRDLRWPVDVGAIGRGFGYVRHDRPNVRHNGFDIATPRGMVIRAAADGIVAYADNELHGYGNCILIAHANGWMTLYAHADRITVQPGYRVRRGERIGFVGATGRADGPHLHFELHVDGEAVDPRAYFHGEPWVEGRARLAILRRDHGGHTYGHLGEIEADYGADPAPRAARTARTSEPRRPSRTTARREASEEARPAETRAAEARTTETRTTEARTASTEPQAASSARSAPTPTRSAPTPAPTRTASAPTPAPTRTASAPRVVEPAPRSDLERWLGEGPTRAERFALRAHPVTAILAPVRLETEATFASGALRYATALSTNVRAAAAGRVAYVGIGPRGALTTIVLLHSNGWVSVYSATMDVTVTVGAIVAQGDRLGIVRDATSGLLFELRDRGQALDPRNRMAPPREVVAVRE